MNSFRLEVMTPSKRFYSGVVEQIIVTTLDGKEGFMADHEWTCKILDAGEFRIREAEADEGEWLVASAAGGFLDMKEDAVVYFDAVEWDRGPEKRKSRQITNQEKSK